MRIHKKHGVLMAGINGYKIYYKDNCFKVVKGHKVLDISSANESAVTMYISMRYYNIKDHDKIRADFLKLVSV